MHRRGSGGDSSGTTMDGRCVMNCGKHLSGRNCWLMVLAVVGLLSVMWAQAGLADTQQGQAPTTLRADLNAPGNPVAVGWVESNFPESATVHLTGALPNTDFVLTSQYWTGTAACGSPDSGGVGYTGSLRTDGSGNGVGQFLYTGWSNAQHQPIPGPPKGYRSSTGESGTGSAPATSTISGTTGHPA